MADQGVLDDQRADDATENESPFDGVKHERGEVVSDDTQLLYLTVMDSEHKLFDGQVVSLSSVNEKGDFDVLQMHAHFITLIQDKLVMREPDGEIEELAIDHGIMKVNEDEVKVFVGMEELHLESEFEVDDKKSDDKDLKGDGASEETGDDAKTDIAPTSKDTDVG